MSPSKEGALFFSDSGLGIHVISHTFFLKDSSARGFQRWFSLIALSTESASGLLQLWNTLVPEMKELIGELQQSAAEVYQREEVQCSHRMLRSTLPHPHVANVGAARSLQDMTGNPVVLLKLHSKLSRMVLLAHFAGQVNKTKLLVSFDHLDNFTYRSRQDSNSLSVDIAFRTRRSRQERRRASWPLFGYAKRSDPTSRGTPGTS